MRKPYFLIIFLLLIFIIFITGCGSNKLEETSGDLEEELESNTQSRQQITGTELTQEDKDFIGRIQYDSVTSNYCIIYSNIESLDLEYCTKTQNGITDVYYGNNNHKNYCFGSKSMDDQTFFSCESNQCNSEKRFCSSMIKEPFYILYMTGQHLTAALSHKSLKRTLNYSDFS